MIPYDPTHFVSLRRVRYRLANYDHVRLPHIEKYANQLEWREGTLEEATTLEELAQRGIRNLQKLADLELCSQVFSLPGTQVGAAASSSTAHQQAAKATDQASSKGKEKEMEPEQPPHEEVQHEEVQQQEMQQQQQVQQQQEGQQEKEKSGQQEHTLEAPISTGQQAQDTLPPRQETTVEASVLQTPQKEDK